jgi:signal transduction histidine kinase
MVFFAISCFLTSILSLLLGIFVLFKERRALLNKIWFAMSLSISSWSFALFKVITSQNLKSAFFWQSLLDISAIFIPAIFFHFSLNFLDFLQIKKYKAQLFMAYFFAFLFSFISPSPLFKKGLAPIFEFNFWIVPGPLYFLFPLFFLILALHSIFLLVKNYPKIKGIKRYQLNYILLATLFGFGGGVTNFFPQLIKVYPFGNFFVVLYLVFIILAITKYHLFDIEVILTEILVGVIGILLVVQIFVAPSTLWKIVNGVIFVLFCIFGYLLIRGVFREIRRREELERISRAKTEFISITSHQLRTPLTVIKGYLSMILEGVYGEVSEKVKKVLENIYLANERLIKLVNSFLNVSKIELGKLELELERADIVEIVESVVRELEIEAKEKNLYLKFEKPKEVPKILIDKEKIREVILNLIDNAIKYTQRGGVEVKLQILNNRLQIVVADTGEGFTKEEREKLFESFSRGSAGQKYWVEGAGIGLYVAKKIVELHQGKIWAESEGKGKGSKFYVELPIK